MSSIHIFLALSGLRPVVILLSIRLSSLLIFLFPRESWVLILIITSATKFVLLRLIILLIAMTKVNLWRILLACPLVISVIDIWIQALSEHWSRCHGVCAREPIVLLIHSDRELGLTPRLMMNLDRWLCTLGTEFSLLSSSLTSDSGLPGTTSPALVIEHMLEWHLLF